MEQEILNIEYHTKRLILKALNQERTVRDAADSLGISERTLYFHMKQYNIKRVPVYVVKGKYKVINQLN